MSYPLFNEELFADSVSKLKNNSNYLGEGFPDEFLSSINRWRSFFIQNPMYGHQIGKNVSIISYYPFALGPDILISDIDGISKNRIEENLSARERIARGKNDGVKVVAFLGGSTIQGYGARLPQFTIPSLVEVIFEKKYDQKIVCINYGVAGWTSKESLNFLLHDLHDGIDMVIAYDGWNCCHELFMREFFIRFKYFEKLGKGSSFRHYEQVFLSSKSYELVFNFRRCINLLVNRFATMLSNRFKFLTARLNFLLQSYFSLAERRLLIDCMERYVFTEKQEKDIIHDIAKDYVDTHIKMKLLCESKQIDFIHILQPLLSTTQKPLSAREVDFKKSGLPWGRPHVYPQFRDKVLSISAPVDFTNRLDGIVDELFVDSGHLNIKGNFVVANGMVTLIKETKF
jgi:hypothetical protein